MHHIPLKKGWVFTEIKGIRDVERSATYHLFDYEELPPIEEELDGSFDWLSNQPEQKDEKAYPYAFGDQLILLRKEADAKGLKVPDSFFRLMGDGGLLRRIRSNTDCSFELGEFIEEVPDTHGMNFIHFMSDSQGCGYWYLCVDKAGNHCVVTSGNLYGHTNKEEGAEEIGYYCAASFEEFIYRFWIENEIWFKTIWDRVALSEVEERYANFYKGNK